MVAQLTKPKISSYPHRLNKKNAAEMDNSELRAQIGKEFRDLGVRNERHNYVKRQHLLLDVANLRGLDAVSWFWKKRRWLWPETPHDLIELRDELREVWRSDSEFWTADSELKSASQDAPGPEPADYFLNKWLSWRPSAEQEETRKSLNRNQLFAVAGSPALQSIIGEGIFSSIIGEDILSSIIGEDINERLAAVNLMQRWSNVVAPFRCCLFSRRLVPEMSNLRAVLVQGVLEHWGRLKHCANAHCLSPYFIAKRKDQTVCDAEICKAEKQREHARKWWNENRSKEAQDETKPSRNTAKKGSKGNVARKTR